MGKQLLTILLEILSSGLQNRTFEGVCEDWDKLYYLAKIHSVENIFYIAIKDRKDVPDEVRKTAKKYYSGNVYQQISQDYYSAQIFAALKEKNISYMPLKGYYLRDLYPSPELRTSCDIDFFYDVSRTKEVEAIMLAEGFKEEKGGLNHSVWRKEEIIFEPHFYLLSDNDIYHSYYKNIWPRLKNVDGSLYEFSDEDFYIYFMVHAAKHFAHGGFGIRTVLDIHVYNQAKNLNREYLNCEFQKLGLRKFVETMEKLATSWFISKTMDEDIKCISEFVMESGTYGADLHRILLNNAKEDSVKSSRWSYVWRVIFLPYKQMKVRYPILEKVPVLLPFYWVKRWVEVLFKRRENISKTMNTMQSINEERVKKYSKILEITEVPLD